MSRVSVIGYRFVSDGAFSEKQRELILADPRVREVRPGPGWRRSFDDINNHGGDERDDRAGDQGRDPEQGGQRRCRYIYTIYTIYRWTRWRVDPAQ